MKWLDKRYYSIYLVTAIISGCFIFMGLSTFAVFESIGNGKTSSDLALETAKKTCLAHKGELILVNQHNPLYTKCITGRTEHN
ncbi:MAG: hypothetical protein PHW64_04015 [Sulfuricurvum sp.]|nr:hypothetical protein [Sulfuricurvum sp.]